MRLYKENKEEAGLYDICEWFVFHYPEDIFINPEHPVTKIVLICKSILKRKKVK